MECDRFLKERLVTRSIIHLNTYDHVTLFGFREPSHVAFEC